MTDRGPTNEGLAERVFWRRHASPASVWWFVSLYPALILAIYRRSRRLGAAILLSLVVNLLVVAPPETDDAWATRVILGERVWLERGLLSSPGDLAVAAVGGAVNLLTLGRRCAAA